MSGSLDQKDGGGLETARAKGAGDVEEALAGGGVFPPFSELGRLARRLAAFGGVEWCPQERLGPLGERRGSGLLRHDGGHQEVASTTFPVTVVVCL